jgi:hypothetical protein
MKVQEMLGKTVSMRSAPAATGNKIGTIAPYSTISALQIVDDLDHPGDPRYKWLQIASGIYVNYVYPPTGARFRWLDPPPSGKTFPFDLYRVKWDFEIYVNGFAARPAAFQRMRPFDHTLMDEAIQHLWFDQIRLEGAGLPQAELLHAWRWMTASNRFITNRQGPDVQRDYILNERMDKPLPGLFPLASSGNVLKGTPVFDKMWYLAVETMDPTMDFPADLSYDKYPWWIHYGTTTTGKKLADGTYACNPFSTNTWVGRNAPHPIFSTQPVRIDMTLLEKIPAGAPVPSPYNPPRVHSIL